MHHKILVKIVTSSLLPFLLVSPALAKHDRLAINPNNGVIVSGGTDGAIYTYPSTLPTNSQEYHPWDMHKQGGAHFNAAIYANNLFVAVADSSTLYYSADGNTWYPPKKMKSGTANFSAIAYGNGTFVVVANAYGTSYFSTDNAESWDTGVGIGDKAYLYDVIYAENQFIAVGQELVFVSTGTFTYVSAIYTSEKGQSWTPVTSLNGQAAFRAIAFASDQKNKFVAVGDYSTIWYSPDGQKWTQATTETGGPSGSATFTDVTYGNGMFVVVGYQGKIWQSTDGVKWQEAIFSPGASPEDTTFYSVAFGTTSQNGLPSQVFVAVGDRGSNRGQSNPAAVWYSTSGQVWSPAKGIAECPDCTAMSAVEFNGSRFITVPDYDLNNIYFPSYHSTSLDGQNWEQHK